MKEKKKTKRVKVKVVMDIEFDIDEAYEVYNFSAKKTIKDKMPENIAKAYIDDISKDLKPFTYYGVDLNVSNIYIVKKDTVLVELPKNYILI